MNKYIVDTHLGARARVLAPKLEKNGIICKNHDKERTTKMNNYETRESESYEIWLVPNGRMSDFMRGITGRGYPDACKYWGSYDSIDEVKSRLRELADENFRRDGGEYNRIWDECADARPEEADQGFSEPEIACDKYCQECADAFGFEWNDDLKYVRVRKVRNLRNGDVDFVEVI